MWKTVWRRAWALCLFISVAQILQSLTALTISSTRDKLKDSLQSSRKKKQKNVKNRKWKPQHNFLEIKKSLMKYFAAKINKHAQFSFLLITKSK